MASEDKLEVQLNLITSSAEKALDGLTKSVNRSFSGMNLDLGKTSKGVTQIASNFVSLKSAAFAAGTTILTYLGSREVLSKAIAQEEAVNAVAVALGRTGEYSRAALADLENYAKQLQAQTTYGDQEILKQIALAQAFGATADQAKVITRASIELAAATGKSLDEATRQVSKTLGGFAGELGEVNPRIKALSASQLKNGEAARILLEQYGGSAIGKLATYNGALEQSKNAFDGVLEQIGFLITKNPVVVEGINGLAKIFSELAGYLEGNREEIIKFVNDGLLTLLEAAPKIGEFFKFTVNALAIMTKSLSLATAGVGIIVQALLNFGPIKILFDGLVATIGLVVGGIADLLSVLAELPGVSDTLEAMGFNVEELSQSLQKAAKSSYGLVDSFGSDAISKGIDKANEFAFSIADGADEVKNNLNKSIDAGIEKAGKLAKTVGKLSAKGTVELKVVNNTESTKKSIDNYQQLLETAFGGTKGAALGGALINGITNGLKNGKEGARQLLSTMSGAVADAFLPGLGAAVGPIIDVLSQGPAQVRQMVKDFVGAIPDLVENIILALPAVIEEFANQIPLVVERLADHADEIIIALAKAMPKVAIALALESPKIMLALAKEAPQFVIAMVQAIGDAIKKFFGLGGSDGKGISGKGGGAGVGGALSTGPTKNGYANAGLNIVTLGASGVATKTYNELKKRLGFARGGEVPRGYPNDTFPAKLSSSELVIDRSTTKDLKEFLKNGGPSSSDALLARIVRLLEQPQTFQTAVQLNQREFASIMLHSRRTNQRT
jgi:hypothetical protein